MASNNPWGNGPGNQNKNPWGGGPGGGMGGHGPGGFGGGGQPPDIDEVLRRAQENFRQVMPGGFGFGKFLVLGIALVAVLWLASGFYIVQPGRQAVVQRFGDWTRTQVQEGLDYHMPWPIERQTTVNVSEVRRMEIGFAERMTTHGETMKQDIPEESLMLTSDANIVDLDLVVLWNIRSAEDYLFKIRDQENTIKKVAESAIREVVGQTRMFPIITREREEVAKRAKELMTEMLDDYESGVNIRQVLIQQAEVHPDVQNAFQDVQSANQDAIDVQNRAQAYREDIIPKARGQAIQMKQEAEAYRQSTIARAEGDAERFESVYEAYLTGKNVTRERMYIETMENVLKNAEKTLLDSSAGGGAVPYLPLDAARRTRSSSGSQ